MSVVDETLAERVRGRLARTGGAVTTANIVSAVRQERGGGLGGAALLDLAEGMRRELVGAGPLEPLLADPQVTDILVNGADDVWWDRGGGLERTGVRWSGADPVRRLAQRLAASCGRALDDAHPYVDARLPDGTRLHAILPPIAQHGPCLSLRTFRRHAFTLAELTAAGTVGEPVAALLRAVVAARLAYLVTGGTGSGKTTMLAALLGLVPGDERIVLVEDAAELSPTHPHVVGLAARLPNAEGAGEVTLRDLVRQALRMRPDRIVVGECRGAEVAELLSALNTGHDGGAGTLHANTPADVPARLEALGLLGGLSTEALHAQVRAALQMVLHLRRTPGGRVLDEICLLVSDATRRQVSTVTVWDRRHGIGPAAGDLVRLLRERGVTPPPLLLAHPRGEAA